MKLVARIIDNNGIIEESEYSPSSKSFSFKKHESLNKLLQVREFLSNGDVVISYIFDGDYDPRKMVVTKDTPLVITDYFGIKLVKIILEIK